MTYILVLLPKTPSYEDADGNKHFGPDDLRPLSIVNTDNRIIANGLSRELYAEVFVFRRPSDVRRMDRDVKSSGRRDVPTSGRPDVRTSGRPDVGIRIKLLRSAVNIFFRSIGLDRSRPIRTDPEIRSKTGPDLVRAPVADRIGFEHRACSTRPICPTRPTHATRSSPQD